MIDRRSMLTGVVGAGLLATAALAAEPGYDGVWHGALRAGPQVLRLRLEIRPDGVVVMNSLDQGGQPIPGRVVERNAAQIVIEVPAVRGRFTAAMQGTEHLGGTWSQGGASLPLTLDRGEPPAGSAGLPPAYQTPVAALTRARLDAYRQADGVPGMAAASVRRGGAPHFWSCGVRRAGSPVAVADGDSWHIGSQTKSMTATLVARLVEAGRLHWDDTLGGVLGDAVPEMRAEYRPVTFRHLLSHRAGLQGNIPMEQLAAFPRASANVHADRIALLRIALAMPPVGPAETTFSYANNGYIAAGAMAEAVTGQTWETLITRHVFQPLGLSSAGFGPPGRRGAVEAPFGHLASANGPIPSPADGGMTDFPAVVAPAGLVHIDLGDLLKYLDAHRDQIRLLSAESWRTLHTPPFGGDYAMGWIVRPDGIRWHNGSNLLWYSEMAFSSERGWSTTAAANFAGGQRAVDRALVEASLAA